VPDGVEWKRLAALYDLERYLFEAVSPRFQRDRTLSARDFFAIIIWKSNRTKTRIAQGLRVAGATPGTPVPRIAPLSSVSHRLHVRLPSVDSPKYIPPVL
jgi:hypothetical protein